MKCFDTSRMNLFKESETERVLKCSQISAFQHDLEKNHILKSLNFSWTKSLSGICFSEYSDLLEGQAVRSLCVGALMLYY